jgi:hypothetical protein
MLGHVHVAGCALCFIHHIRYAVPAACLVVKRSQLLIGLNIGQAAAF